jgi:tetratricopeptide (TPR) repeat protein
MPALSLPEQLWQAAQQAFQRADFPAARRACERVIGSEPLHSGARLMLSNLASSEGRHRLSSQHALAAAEKMGRQSLQHIAAVSLKLISVGEYENAVTLIRKIDPSAVPAPSSLAEFSQQLSLLEQHDEALRYMEAALALGLDGDWAHYIHGNYLKFLGRMDEAAVAYEQSLRRNPDYAFSHLAIATLDRPEGSAVRIDRLRRSLASAPGGLRDLAYLNYALFKELDSAGDSEAAWPALEAGFRAKRQEVSHDAAAETALFDALIAATGDFGKAGADPNAASSAATPIFVLGMPRTGTTLLERILGAHPQIALCGELNDFRMQYKWASDHFCLGFFDRAAVQRLSGVDYGLVGQRYLQHVAWRISGARYFTDKNPGNFMMAGLILRALPQARIIHLRRNPMDSCFSNLKELFGSNAHPYSYDFADLASHYGNYSRLMAHWHQLYPGRILDLDYEDMVSDPDTAARRVMAYCGLSYDPMQIRVESSRAPVSTASSAQVRQPIHARNIGGWKRYARQLAPLQALLDAAGR